MKIRNLRGLESRIKIQVKQKSADAFNKVAKELDAEFRATISEPQYWGGFENSVTHRQNGEVVVGAFRNIIDSGDLANSQTLFLNPNPNALKASFAWGGTGDTPVTAVFFGYRTESTYVAGRDWVTATLVNLNVSDLLRRHFN